MRKKCAGTCFFFLFYGSKRWILLIHAFCTRMLAYVGFVKALLFVKCVCVCMWNAIVNLLQKYLHATNQKKKVCCTLRRRLNRRSHSDSSWRVRAYDGNNIVRSELRETASESEWVRLSWTMHSQPQCENLIKSYCIIHNCMSAHISSSFSTRVFFSFFL